MRTARTTLALLSLAVLSVAGARAGAPAKRYPVTEFGGNEPEFARDAVDANRDESVRLERQFPVYQYDESNRPVGKIC